MENQGRTCRYDLFQGHVHISSITLFPILALGSEFQKVLSLCFHIIVIHREKLCQSSLNLFSGTWLGQHFDPCPFLWQCLFPFHWEPRGGSGSGGFEPPLWHSGPTQQWMCAAGARAEVDLPLGRGAKASLLLSQSRVHVYQWLLPASASASLFEPQFWPVSADTENSSWTRGQGICWGWN